MQFSKKNIIFAPQKRKTNMETIDTKLSGLPEEVTRERLNMQSGLLNRLAKRHVLLANGAVTAFDQTYRL